MFQNMLFRKSFVLKCKELSQNVRTGLRSFCKCKSAFVNITIGSEGQVLNCPHVLLKTQFYPLINQGRSPFAAPEPFDKLTATKTTKK